MFLSGWFLIISHLHYINIFSFVDSNNPEILWRLSRVLAEKAELTKDAKKKSELLHDAVHLAESALKFEGKHGIAQAHKWFAISAVRFAHVDKKAGKCPKLKEKIVTHLKRAVELDPKVYFIVFLDTLILLSFRIRTLIICWVSRITTTRTTKRLFRASKRLSRSRFVRIL